MNEDELKRYKQAIDGFYGNEASWNNPGLWFVRVEDIEASKAALLKNSIKMTFKEVKGQGFVPERGPSRMFVEVVNSLYEKNALNQEIFDGCQEAHAFWCPKSANLYIAQVTASNTLLEKYPKKRWYSLQRLLGKKENSTIEQIRKNEPCRGAIFKNISLHLKHINDDTKFKNKDKNTSILADMIEPIINEIIENGNPFPSHLQVKEAIVEGLGLKTAGSPENDINTVNQFYKKDENVNILKRAMFRNLKGFDTIFNDDRKFFEFVRDNPVTSDRIINLVLNSQFDLMPTRWGNIKDLANNKSEELEIIEDILSAQVLQNIKSISPNNSSEIIESGHRIYYPCFNLTFDRLLQIAKAPNSVEELKKINGQVKNLAPPNDNAFERPLGRLNERAKRKGIITKDAATAIPLAVNAIFPPFDPTKISNATQKAFDAVKNYYDPHKISKTTFTNELKHLKNCIVEAKQNNHEVDAATAALSILAEHSANAEENNEDIYNKYNPTHLAIKKVTQLFLMEKAVWAELKTFNNENSIEELSLTSSLVVTNAILPTQYDISPPDLASKVSQSSNLTPSQSP